MPASQFQRLLIDTNLFVLWVVGIVNTARISGFKRTSKYDAEDFHLLVRHVLRGREIFTSPHILAEVSNLTDLTGRERDVARNVLKSTLASMKEVFVPAIEISKEVTYPRLGLSDAGIVNLAQNHQCHVATDDFDLYLALTKESLSCTNFTHLRAQFRGL
jgi:hypothetical protein